MNRFWCSNTDGHQHITSFTYLIFSGTMCWLEYFIFWLSLRCKTSGDRKKKQARVCSTIFIAHNIIQRVLNPGGLQTTAKKSTIKNQTSSVGPTPPNATHGGQRAPIPRPPSFPTSSGNLGSSSRSVPRPVPSALRREEQRKSFVTPNKDRPGGSAQNAPPPRLPGGNTARSTQSSAKSQSLGRSRFDPVCISLTTWTHTEIHSQHAPNPTPRPRGSFPITPIKLTGTIANLPGLFHLYMSIVKILKTLSFFG